MDTSKKFNMNLITVNTMKYNITHYMQTDILINALYDSRDTIIVSNSESFEPSVLKLKYMNKDVYAVFTENVSDDLKYV